MQFGAHPIIPVVAMLMSDGLLHLEPIKDQETLCFGIDIFMDMVEK